MTTRGLACVTVIHPVWHEWFNVTTRAGDPEAYARTRRASRNRRDRHA